MLTALIIAAALGQSPTANAAPSPASSSAQRAASPEQWLTLYPQNSRYLQYHGKPVLLVTSGEHYGAVLNKDFDNRTYLNTLAADGLNLTRVFSGAYYEPQGAFNIARNTLAPPGTRFIAPWARSRTPGAIGGGEKFDLDRWDDRYFTRLKDFVKHARSKNIIVEMNVFCPFYEEVQWSLSPMNPRNNIQNLGEIAAENVYTLTQHGGLLPVQEKLLQKLADELKDDGNVYFEICNEPYIKQLADDWQRHMTDVLAQHEADRPNKHLISWNIANDHAVVNNPHPALSIFNFHYAWPPVVIGMNQELRGVIGDNETGFDGTSDAVYRREAWEFLLAGGGLFNNLDYSFVVGHEKGDFQYPESQPGGGGKVLRKQLGFLRSTLESLPFTEMKPCADMLKTEIPPGGSFGAMGSVEHGYLVYFHGWGLTQEASLSLPNGEYTLTRLDPEACGREELKSIESSGSASLPLKGATDCAFLLSPKE